MLTITISGNVFKSQDDNRQSVAGATVMAESVRGEPRVTIEQQTNDEGAYTLSELRLGRWRLSVKTTGLDVREPVIADFNS